MNMENFNQLFRERTKNLALKVVLTLSDLKYSDALSVFRKQAIRCATSIAANYRSACRARSIKEKYAKMCIVVEESDETQFWLEMLLASKFLSKEAYDPIYDECTEIVKVMTTFKKSLSSKL